MNATQIRNQLEQKINEQQKVVAAGSISVASAKEATARWNDALDALDVEGLKSIDEQMAPDAAAISNAANLIESLKVSLALDLIHVATKYVITDRDLISPSGFHTEDRVFVKNSVFILTNDLPGSLSGGLRAYKV
jgi:hypothetical protein